MFDRKYRGTAMAFAIVAMFLLSAVAVMITPSDAARDTYPQTEEPYEIYMFTGDTFTYEPTANLEGTQFSWAPTGITSGDMRYNASPITQSITEPKTAYFKYTPSTATTSAKVILTANHATSDQTITQEIRFKVTDHMAISASYNGGASANVGFNPTVTVPMDTESYQAVFTVSNGLDPLFDISGYTVKYRSLDSDTYAEILGSDFVKSTTGQTFTISFDHAVTGGFYQFTVPVGWHKDYDTQGSDGMIRGNSESKNLVFTLIVSDGVSIPEFNAVGIAGESRAKTIEISNVSSVSSMNFTLQPVNALTGTAATLNEHTSIALVNTGDFSRAALTLDATSITNNNINGNSLSYDLNVQVAGMRTFGSSETEYASSGLAHVTLYKSLAFTTTPVISAGGTNVYVSSNNGLDVLLTTSVTGAQKITYDWGDGTAFVKDTSSASGTYFSANHTYAKAGTYFIDITAENDFGKTSYIKPYTTGTYINLDLDKTLKVTDIKATESEGNLVLKANTIVQAGIQPEYKWSYSVDGADAVEITPAVVSETEFIETMAGNILVLVKDKLQDNTKFTCVASYTFADDTEPTISTASHVYNDTGFFAVHGFLFIITMILAVMVLAVMAYMTGFNPYLVAVVVALVVLSIALFFCKDFGGIFDAIKGLFGVS